MTLLVVLFVISLIMFYLFFDEQKNGSKKNDSKNKMTHI